MKTFYDEWYKGRRAQEQQLHDNARKAARDVIEGRQGGQAAPK